jgi:hypothetical protein
LNFREWIEQFYLLKRKTQKDAAFDLKLTEATISAYVNFKRFPKPENASELENACLGLNIEQWRRDYISAQAEHREVSA